MKEISTQQWFVNIITKIQQKFLHKASSIVSERVPYVPIVVPLTAEIVGPSCFLKQSSMSTWKYTYLCTSVYEYNNIICAVRDMQSATSVKAGVTGIWYPQ